MGLEVSSVVSSVISPRDLDLALIGGKVLLDHLE